jgi:hypothetical protein
MMALGHSSLIRPENELMRYRPDLKPPPVATTGKASCVIFNFRATAHASSPNSEPAEFRISLDVLSLVASRDTIGDSSAI